ncbi:MAG: glycosyltransferase family 39 protein [Desulfovibrio sp.]|nr:glycosyltransferase family 39 protein [Desulfovibrio sp.]
MRKQIMLLERNTSSQRDTGDFCLAAFLMVALGAALRFYNLGEPSMWADEMLVALNASKEPAYIFSLSQNVEVHPPYFYFLYKLLFHLGSSDFWLRLPSAVFGTATLYFVWRAGERHLESRFAALAALGMLAAHPLHIWISRQVRPYALIALCFILAAGYLLRYLEEGDSRQARRNLLACLPMVLSHYVGLLALGTQWVVAAVAALFRGVPSLGSVVGYGCGAVLCALPSAYFFWEAKFNRHEASIEAGKGIVPALEKVLSSLQGVLSFGADVPYAWAAMAGLMLAGTLSLLFRRASGSALIALFVLPPVALVLAQYASHMYAVHLSFLLPVAVLLAGAGLEGLAPRALCRPWFALVLCLCLSGTFVSLKSKDYYEAKGVVAAWWHMGFYKDIAQMLRQFFTPADMIAFHDPALFESVNWYASRQGPGVPASQRLKPEAQTVMAVFVTNHEHFGHAFKNESEFRTLFGQSAVVAHRDNMNLYQTAIARNPDMVFDGKHVFADLTARPTDVYSRAWSLTDLGLLPYFGCSLFPSSSGQPGEVVYRITRAGEHSPMRFDLLADFELEAPGTLIRIEYKFDQSSWTTALEEKRQSKGTCRLIRFNREEPFEHLWLRAVLVAGEKVATSEWGARTQVRLNRLMLFSEQDGASFGSRTVPLRESGLGSLEVLPGDVFMRWGLGEVTALAFDQEEEKPLVLSYRFVSRVAGQGVEVLRDGQRLALYQNLEPGQEVAEVMELAPKSGPGLLEFRPATWNHKDASSTFAPDDPRQLSVMFFDLSLESQDHSGPPPPPQVLPK